MGTVRCRYPSSWVPLLVCHSDSRWRTSSACALASAQRGGCGVHRGGSPRGCSGVAASTQEGRSPACQRPPCQGQEHLCGPGKVMGQGGGCQHHANGVVQPRRLQPCYLPTPRVSQGCLLFPGPQALPRSPQLLPQLLGGILTLQHPLLATGWMPAPILAPGACRGQEVGSVLADRSHRSWWRRERLGWQPAEPRRGPAVPGPGHMPATSKVTLHGHPAPPTCATHLERGTWVPIPALCCCPHPHRAPQRPWPHIPCPCCAMWVPYPAPPTPLDPTAPLLISSAHCTPSLPPTRVLAGPSVSSAPRPHLQSCRMSAAICLSLLISINF